jgi:hypothetical protein
MYKKIVFICALFPGFIFCAENKQSTPAPFFECNSPDEGKQIVTAVEKIFQQQYQDARKESSILMPNKGDYILIYNFKGHGLDVYTDKDFAKALSKLQDKQQQELWDLRNSHTARKFGKPLVNVSGNSVKSAWTKLKQGLRKRAQPIGYDPVSQKEE